MFHISYSVPSVRVCVCVGIRHRQGERGRKQCRWWWWEKLSVCFVLASVRSKGLCVRVCWIYFNVWLCHENPANTEPVVNICQLDSSSKMLLLRFRFFTVFVLFSLSITLVSETALYYFLGTLPMIVSFSSLVAWPYCTVKKTRSFFQLQYRFGNPSA